MQSKFPNFVEVPCVSKREERERERKRDSDREQL